MKLAYVPPGTRISDRASGLESALGFRQRSRLPDNKTGRGNQGIPLQLQWHKSIGGEWCLLDALDLAAIDAYGVFVVWRPGNGRASQVLYIGSGVLRHEIANCRRAPILGGASDLRILYVHIFPNVLPMALLYVAFDIAWAVLAEASIAFLGFGDPQQTSWGQMLYLAYVSGSIRQAWWWTIPPGATLSLFVISVFLIGREYERLANPRLR